MPDVMQICNQICKLPPFYLALVMLAFLCFETWLGKTDKVKSGSILELIFNLLIAIPRKLFHTQE